MASRDAMSLRSTPAQKLDRVVAVPNSLVLPRDARYGPRLVNLCRHWHAADVGDAWRALLLGAPPIPAC